MSEVMSEPFSEALDSEPGVTGPLASAPFHYKQLEPRQCRWYWTKPSFSAKSQTAPLDIPHRAQIQRFCNADSEALEEIYRTRQDELEAAWWQEHSELAAGPAASAPKDRPSTPPGGSPGGSPPPSSMSKTVVHVAARRQELLERETSATSWKEFQAGGRTKEAPVGTLVRGGLWEVDLLLRLMSPCYWPEAQHRVARGTWFVEKGPDWVPIRETLADELETAYRSEVWDPKHRLLAEQPQGIIAARVNLASATMKGQYALFSSATEVYLCRDDMFSWASRKMGSKGAAGMRLRRGYEQPHQGSLEVDAKAEEADEAAAAQPVDRLILAVHGIGQKLSGANIVDDAASLRALVRSAASDSESIAAAGGGGGRVELLPVQWRKGLDLGVDELAQTLMPANLEALRGIFHATAVEVLLYLTPLHCQDMLDSVVVSLNAVYAKFMRRNPDFRGNISIVAHSLGSLLTWDILSCQPRLFATLPVQQRLTPTGAADASLQALERLGAAPASQQQPAQASSSQPDTAAAAAEAPATAASGGGGGACIPGAALVDVQPLTSRDLDGSAMEPPAAAPAQVEKADRAEASRPKAEDGDAAAAEQAAADAVTGDTPEQGDTKLPEVERLRMEVQELRTRLRTATAERNTASTTSSTADGAVSPPPDPQAMAAAGLQPLVRIAQLDFPVDQYISIGSPIGLFLALRKIDPGQGSGLGTPAAAKLMPGGGGGCDGLPAVNRAFNLYQPYDPVAYRLEPLAVRGGEKVRPLFAPYHRGGRRLHIGLQEFSEDVGSAVGGFSSSVGRVSSNVWGSLRGGIGRAAAAVTVAKAEAGSGGGGGGGGPQEQPAQAASSQAAEAEAGARADESGTAFWRLTEGRGSEDGKSAAGRIDFVLQAAPTENAYLSAISSHFSYWNSADTALLLARAVSGLDVLTGRPKHEQHAEGKHADGRKPKSNRQTPHSSPPGTPPGQLVSSGKQPPLSPQELVDRAWQTSGV